MAVSDQHVEAIEALLSGDIERHKQLWSQLRDDEDARAAAALVGAGFVRAVERRFGGQAGSDPSDIETFVSNVRLTGPGMAEDLEAQPAEQLINAALGRGGNDGLDEATIARTQVLLLGALVAEEQFDETQLRDFLADARRLADSWLTDDSAGV